MISPAMTLTLPWIRSGALVKPGLTGTNVMDIVIGICGNGQG